jgi:malate permease and related proteins
LFWNSIQAVLILMILTGIGFGLSAAKILGKPALAFCSKAVFYVGAPCMLYISITSTMTKELLLSSLSSMIIPAGTFAIFIVIGIILARAFKMPERRSGIFITSFAFANTMFVGLPVALALYGQAGVLPTLFVFIPNTLLYWTVGIYFIAKGGNRRSALFSLQTLKNVFSPPLIGSILAIVAVVTGFQMPDFLNKTIGYCGDLTVPLSMIFSGAVIQQAGFRQGLKADLSLVFIILSHTLLMPMARYASCYWMGVTGVTRGIFVVQGALPVMSTVAIVADQYGVDTEYATRNFVWTMLLSFAFIPIYMILLGVLP